MALKLGELATILTADDGPLRKGLDKARGLVEKHGEKISAIGGAAGAAAGVALSAGLASAVQLDSAQTKLAAQLGLSEAEADKVGKIAGAVYAQGWGESAAAVAESLRGVLTTGLIDKDAAAADIQAVTTKAQALSDVFGLDVTEAARAAGQMVKTGLAKNASDAFDILTKGFQATGDPAGDLLDTFSEYGTQFRKLGIDGATATGLLSQGLKAGARDADIVADAIKEFSIRAVDGSKSSSDGFKALGLNASKLSAQIGQGGSAASAGLDTVLDRLRAIPDPVKRSQVAVQLFGTQAEDLGAALYSLDPSSAVNALGQVGGAADKLGETVGQSASAQLESFKRQAQGALVEKLATAIPYIRDVASFLQQNSAIVGPLATGLGILAGVIGTIVAITRVYTIVQTALNVVMSMNPIGLVIIAVGLLIAGVALIATKTRFFQTVWAVAWGGIKAAAAAVGSWFRDTLWGSWIKGAWNGIVAGGSAALGWFRRLPGLLKAALVKVADILTWPFRTAFNAIASLWNRSIGKIAFTLPGWVPGIGGSSFSLPKIPMLAHGGIMPATPGGRLAVLGEGGQDEAVIPLSRLAGLLGGAAGRTVLELRSSGSRLADLLVEILRDFISARGGDVQVVLGR